MIKYLLLLLSISLLNGCSTHVERKSESVRFSRVGRFIIRQQYDSSGKLLLRQFFNKDTVPDGHQTYYYLNGQIRKWKLFKKDTVPVCGSYYDSSGNCYAFRGNPFIASGRDRNDGLYVTMVVPPSANFIVLYRDSFNKKVRNQLIYDPVITDSNSYIVIKRTKDEFKYQTGHVYTLYFYIIGSEHNVLAGGETALELFDDKYDFISAPQLPKKILIGK